MVCFGVGLLGVVVMCMLVDSMMVVCVLCWFSLVIRLGMVVVGV